MIKVNMKFFSLSLFLFFLFVFHFGIFISNMPINICFLLFFFLHTKLRKKGLNGRNCICYSYTIIKDPFTNIALYQFLICTTVLFFLPVPNSYSFRSYCCFLVAISCYILLLLLFARSKFVLTLLLLVFVSSNFVLRLLLFAVCQFLIRANVYCCFCLSVPTLWYRVLMLSFATF